MKENYVSKSFSCLCEFSSFFIIALGVYFLFLITPSPLLLLLLLERGRKKREEEGASKQSLLLSCCPILPPPPFVFCVLRICLLSFIACISLLDLNLVYICM